MHVKSRCSVCGAFVAVTNGMRMCRNAKHCSVGYLNMVEERIARCEHERIRLALLEQAQLSEALTILDKYRGRCTTGGSA